MLKFSGFCGIGGTFRDLMGSRRSGRCLESFLDVIRFILIEHGPVPSHVDPNCLDLFSSVMYMYTYVFYLFMILYHIILHLLLAFLPSFRLSVLPLLPAYCLSFSHFTSRPLLFVSFCFHFLP